MDSVRKEGAGLTKIFLMPSFNNLVEFKKVCTDSYKLLYSAHMNLTNILPHSGIILIEIYVSPKRHLFNGNIFSVKFVQCNIHEYWQHEKSDWKSEKKIWPNHSFKYLIYEIAVKSGVKGYLRIDCKVLIRLSYFLRYSIKIWTF